MAPILVPYFLFGLLLKTALTNAEGWHSGYASATLFTGIALGGFWLFALVTAFRYRKFLGMDCGFWLIGIPVTVSAAAGISLLVSYMRWRVLTP